MAAKEDTLIHKISVYYKEDRLLECRNISLSPGTVSALVGSSGSGKTLTALALLNLIPFAAPGLKAEADITFPTPANGFRLSYVPQGTGFHLQPTVSIRSQIRDLVCGKGGLSSEAYSEKEAFQLLRRMRFRNPEKLITFSPMELSGGMLQRVLLAIAFLRRPHLMILDEPTTALDSYARTSVYREILDCVKEYNTTVLVLTHNNRDIAVLADRVYVINNGKVSPGPEPKTFSHNTFTGHKREEQPSIRESKWKITDLTVSLSSKRKTFGPSFFGNKTNREPFCIEPFSIQLNTSDCLGIIGESGCGKTTLLRAMACLIKINGGQILLDAEDLTKKSQKGLRVLRKYFQVVFQDSSKSLNPLLTVKDILREPFIIHKEKVPDENTLKDVLTRVVLPKSILDRKVTELSFGQRQRLALLRALYCFPHLKVLMIDEPFSGLDAEAARAVIAFWRKKADHLITIMASHEIEWIQALSNKVHVIKDGNHIETFNAFQKDTISEYTQAFWKAGLVADRESLMKFHDVHKPVIE
jgi:microcin C transport system ATP-binding protein